MVSEVLGGEGFWWRMALEVFWMIYVEHGVFGHMELERSEGFRLVAFLSRYGVSCTDLARLAYIWGSDVYGSLGWKITAP